jgi:hypothetical protein
METLKILIKPLSKLKNGNIKLKITDKDKKPLRDIVVSDFITIANNINAMPVILTENRNGIYILTIKKYIYTLHENLNSGDFIELYLKVRLYGMEYASGLIRIEQN